MLEQIDSSGSWRRGGGASGNHGKCPQEERVSFEEGDKAMLTGFTERQDLNGEPVELIRWDQEKEGWVVRRQTEQSITSLVSLSNLKPYPRKDTAPKKEREFNIVSFLATIIGGVILLGTAITVIVPLFLALYKDMTGEYLVTLDLPSTI